MLRSPLLATTIALLSLAVPAGARAATTPFPVGSNWILSGTDALDAGEPMPVADSSIGSNAVSADGRYVAFSSAADGLSAEDDDGTLETFVKDRQTGAVTLVSRRSGAAGTAAGGYGCTSATLSADGTRVAFACSDPLDPADTNDSTDVYVRDWQAANPTTTLVARQSGLGAPLPNGAYSPSLSATGEYVAFASTSPAVPAVDTNDEYDVYRRRIGSGDAVVLVSRVPGGAVANKESDGPSISDDGQRVAFQSDATNLGFGATTHQNVYVATPDANQLVVASAKTLVNDYPNADSSDPVLSGDGKVVAFTSSASDFNDGDADTGLDVHTRTLATSVTSAVTAAVNGDSFSPSLDADGSAVGFVTTATNASASDIDPDESAYVREGGTTTLISRRDGDLGSSSASRVRAIAVDGDGQIAAFDAEPGNLTVDADPGTTNVYARDRAAAPDRTRLVSRPAGDGPFVNTGMEANASDQSVSADARKVVYSQVVASRRTLVVRDVRTGARVIAGRADGPEGAVDFDTRLGAISADGTRVAWITDAPLDPADTNATTDVYLRDLAANRTFLVSRADGAAGKAVTNASYYPVLDADGSRVAFFSYAQDFGDGLLGGEPNMHVRDLATGRTILASGKDGPDAIGGNDYVSDTPAISADGTKVAFQTRATDLGDGDVDPQDDIHVRDLAAQTTRLVSATPAGVAADGSASSPTMSADGQRIAFASSAKNLVPGIVSGTNVYVRDLAAGTISMPARTDGAQGEPANAEQRDPRLSRDGRFLMFSSSAQNLGAEFGSGTQLFLRDLTAATTTLASRAADGTPIRGDITAVALSDDAACVVFAAEAKVIAGPASPDYQHLYLRALRPRCVRADPTAAVPLAPPAPSPAPPAPAAKDTKAPVLSKVSLSRKRFRVSAKATALAARTGAGTTLRFTLSETAKLTVTVERARPGRRIGKTCKRVARKVAKRACTAYTPDGTLTRKGLAKGARSLAFSGRLGKRKLAAGQHRLTLRATDAAGNRSKPVVLTFTVVKR